MDERFRRFITIYVLELIKLSESSNPKAAAIVRGDRIIVSSYSKRIITGLDSSPVVDSYLELLRTIKYIKEDYTLHIICSYFPSFEEFLFLCHTKIHTVYYIGEIQEEKTVRFLNKLSKENNEKNFEIIKINFK